MIGVAIGLLGIAWVGMGSVIFGEPVFTRFPELYLTTSALVMFFALIIGMAVATINIPAQTIVQERSNDAVRGRVLAVQFTIANAVAIPPMLLIGHLADLYGIPRVTVLVAVGVAGVAGVTRYGHSRPIVPRARGTCARDSGLADTTVTTSSPQRILFLFSDTGGGHRSAAEAIISALARQYPDRYTCTLIDVFKRAARFPLNYAPEMYLPFTTYLEWLWGLGFWVLNNRIATRLVKPYLYVSILPRLRALLRAAQPDLVVSTHPIFVSLGYRALRQSGSRAPFVTVVTDLFDAHCFWFDPRVDLCLVPTAGAYRVAQRFGMPAEKLRSVGQPIALQFADSHLSQRAARQKLGLDLERPTVLLVGGGEGMGPLYTIARALDEAHLPIQLVVIAGRNQKLLEKLRATQWHLPVHCVGFVTNMPEWMRAADVIITKAGPGTICEALACGLPIVLSGYLPGQETGNVTFVEQTGVGVLRRHPGEIVHTLREWLAPGNDALARYAARAREQARPYAAIDIARILNDLLAQ